MTDILAYRGETMVFDTTVTDGDGQPVNLTGATIYFTARRSYDSTTPMWSLVSTSSGVSITNATAGIITVILTAAQTGSSPPILTDYWWDIMIQDSAGYRWTVDSGKLQIAPTATVI